MSKINMHAGGAEGVQGWFRLDSGGADGMQGVKGGRGKYLSSENNIIL